MLLLMQDNVHRYIPLPLEPVRYNMVKLWPGIALSFSSSCSKVPVMMDNRSKIIEVATKVISEKGYHGASMQMIADKVGITKSTVFHYFKNKEALLLAILEKTVPQATYNLTLILNDSALTPREKLKAFFRLQLKLVKEQGEVLNLYLTESRHLSKRQREMYLQSRRVYTDLVKQIIKELQQEPRSRLAGLNPTVTANAILGMCNWAVTWYKKSGELDIFEIADQFYQIIMGENDPEQRRAEVQK
jgi:AcrR family transcriptional regulator